MGTLCGGAPAAHSRVSDCLWALFVLGGRAFLARRASVRHAFADSRYRLALHLGRAGNQHSGPQLRGNLNFPPPGNPNLDPRPGDNADGPKLSGAEEVNTHPLNQRDGQTGVYAPIRIHIFENTERSRSIYTDYTSPWGKQVCMHLLAPLVIFGSLFLDWCKHLAVCAPAETS